MDKFYITLNGVTEFRIKYHLFREAAKTFF